ncbi:DMT family transporter [Phenylobacterium soli]|uniref:Permease n=1 Tax=Phenylobacterium soli TaxID=2170551 RepID=A0A328AK57_9CAUL|nr:EamA family transporter [Phenylobacterium soli]RAK54775.1 permease [Phenylobacterium soli]
MTAEKLVPAALGLLGFCIAAETVQQLSFKVGNGRAESRPGFVRAILTQPLIWTGILLWIVESIAWVLVLQKSPLSMAYPVMTLTYATVPLAGLVLLRERMSRRQMAGAALIFAGVLLVGVSGA